MSSYALPFPGRDLAEKELSYDPCCPRIPEADRARIVDAAWKKGCAAARDVFAQSDGSADFFAICKANGLTVVERLCFRQPALFQRLCGGQKLRHPLSQIGGPVGAAEQNDPHGSGEPDPQP